MWSRRGIRRRVGAGLLVACVAALGICGNAVWSAPPRFDGAGYALLARALLAGEGYRNVDHPDRPRHAHFPPGYPAVLALLWSVTGLSARAAHLASACFAIGACVATWCWYRSLLPRRSALALGLALAANWLWARTGSAIQSEPLFMLLSAWILLGTIKVGRFPRGWPGDRVLLSALLAASLLTRHAAVGLALAILVDLALRGRSAQALAVAAVTSLLCAPWLGWLLSAGPTSGTQIDLLVQGDGSPAERIARQCYFYLQRIPDAITGPYVEVGTIYQSVPQIATLASAWGVLASVVIGAGWLRLALDPRRRLAGLVPLVTLGVLFVWPYTEAGRFLIPLIPFILIGAVEGMAFGLTRLAHLMIGRLRSARARVIASCVVLAASIPYSAYMAAAGRARAQELTQRDFDAACAWLAGHADRPGPVLSRHPGDVFWRSGRPGLEVASAERAGVVDASSDAIATVIQKYGAAYILVDQEPYSNAPPVPLARFVAERSEAVRKVWERGSVVVYEVDRPH
jgi:Dolichyl-phosphate-mannose-protein mannosyltransferase